VGAAGGVDTDWIYDRWGFYADMNRDGRINVSDAVLWAGYIALAPGDFVIFLLLRFPAAHAAVTGLLGTWSERWLSYGSAPSIVLSILFWFWVLYALRQLFRREEWR
jgi:hypothetical protein